MRSPYGVARNPFNADYIPGGSSSGSAVAVSAGLVSFSLGTDTAGSGRVPAGFNNIVGLKPTVGLLSASGMLPACKALDCISIFALTVNDASAVLGVAAGYDAADGYSRPAPAGWRAVPAGKPQSFRFGVPRQDQLKFFGNSAAEALFLGAVDRMTTLGGEKVEIDYTPFAEAAGLLYTPAGTAERTAAVGDFLNSHAEAMHPVTRKIIEAGKQATGVDVHRHYYRIRELQQASLATWDQIDVLLLPTSGTIYTVKELEAEPIQYNSNLGYYTNFVNYFDLAALAVPNGFQPNGLPAGITLIGPRFSEPLLAMIGEAWQRDSGLSLGATRHALPETTPVIGTANYPSVTVAVFGAHMSGLPLNYQLREIGARLLSECSTAPDYLLYVIAGALPRPGLVRTGKDGKSILGELWQIPTAGFGAFVAAIPAPLGIGDVTLDDGRVVKGFLCEAVAAEEAPDITSLGGWRAWLETSRREPALAAPGNLADRNDRHLADMAAHGGLGTGRIAGENGLHHAIMLSVGIVQATQYAELRAAEGQDAPARRPGRLGQEVVLAATIDQVVKIVVEGCVTGQVAILHQRQRGVVNACKFAAFRRGHAQSGEAGAGGFHLGHHLEHFLNAAGGGQCNQHTAMRAVFHQANASQRLERLANRCARHAEGLGQISFVEPGTGQALAGHDLLGERVPQLFGQSALLVHV